MFLHKYCSNFLEDCLLYWNDLSYMVHEWPVALTSAERVFLCKLEKLVKDYVTPLQFAYRKNRSTDDAVLYNLEYIYWHLGKNSTVKTHVLQFFQCL